MLYDFANLRRRVWPSVVLIIFLAAAPAFSQAAESSVDRTITQIRGDLYGAQEGARSTVFLVARDEILLVDPLNNAFARWLIGELGTMFPGRPVKHVVYSSFDFDRVGGVGVFRQLPHVLAHKAFNARSRRTRQLPPRYALYDRDASGALETVELAQLEQSDPAQLRDRNSDGRVTGEELWSDIPDADDTYASHRTVALGD